MPLENLHPNLEDEGIDLVQLVEAGQENPTGRQLRKLIPADLRAWNVGPAGLLPVIVAEVAVREDEKLLAEVRLELRRGNDAVDYHVLHVRSSCARAETHVGSLQFAGLGGEDLVCSFASSGVPDQVDQQVNLLLIDNRSPLHARNGRDVDKVRLAHSLLDLIPPYGISRIIIPVESENKCFDLGAMTAKDAAHQVGERVIADVGGDPSDPQLPLAGQRDRCLHGRRKQALCQPNRSSRVRSGNK
mmetsp:Transcript_10776/g.24502  ORF Transcript_10776/g.24502 Transcript_10776/m.24502 type:complete len:245 (+) Transcript_10776:346-1080(+)